MAVQTPIANSEFDIVAGSLRVSITKFTSVADGDTYVSALTQIIGFSCDASTATPTVAVTYSATGTVTFHVGSGPALLVSLVLFGY